MTYHALYHAGLNTIVVTAQASAEGWETLVSGSEKLQVTLAAMDLRPTAKLVIPPQAPVEPSVEPQMEPKKLGYDFRVQTPRGTSQRYYGADWTVRVVNDTVEVFFQGSLRETFAQGQIVRID